MSAEDANETPATRDDSLGVEAALPKPRRGLYSTWEFWFLAVMLVVAAIGIFFFAVAYRRLLVMNYVEDHRGECT